MKANQQTCAAGRSATFGSRIIYPCGKSGVHKIGPFRLCDRHLEFVFRALPVARMSIAILILELT